MGDSLFKVERMLSNTGDGAISAVVFGHFIEPEAIDSNHLQRGVNPGKLSDVKGIILVKNPPEHSTSVAHLGMALKNKWYCQAGLGAIEDPLGDGRDGSLFDADEAQVRAALSKLAGIQIAGKTAWLENVSGLKEINLGRGGIDRSRA